MKNSSYIRYALVLCITMASIPQRTDARLLSIMLITTSVPILLAARIIIYKADEKVVTEAHEKYTQIDLKHGHLLDLFEKDPSKLPASINTEQLVDSLVEKITHLSGVQEALGKQLNHAASISIAHDTNIVKDMQEIKQKIEVYAKRLRALLQYLQTNMLVEQKQASESKFNIA